MSLWRPHGPRCGNHDYGSLVASLMDLSDPNVILQVFRKADLYRGRGLVWIYKPQTYGAKFGQEPSTNLFDLWAAERRPVHHVQRYRSRTRSRGNFSRQFPFGRAPITG